MEVGHSRPSKWANQEYQTHLEMNGDSYRLKHSRQTDRPQVAN